jgi:sulfur carrier protein
LAAAPVTGERPFVFITVNGKEMDVEPGMSVDGLLALLNIKREYTAVAVNREIAPKSEYGTVKLGEGDKVEIVRPMGGG